MTAMPKLSGNYERDVERGVFRIDEDSEEFQSMYEQVSGWRNIAPDGRRLDAGETATITRQLLYVKAQTYDVKYPEFRARSFIPVSHDVPTGAQSWSWTAYQEYGMAKIIANYANDFPRVDVTVSENFQKIAPLGAGYGYTVQDLRSAAFAAMNSTVGANIEVKKAAKARKSIEQAIDQLAAVGSTDVGMTGFINNALVPVAAAPTGNWRTATPLQIIGDLNYMWQTIMNATIQIEIPDSIILAPEQYNIITGMPFSTLGNMSVANWFIANNPHGIEMDQWYWLSLADAAGTGPRQVCYKRSADNVFMEVPQEFEQFAPELKGMEYTIDCHARFGGTVFTYPLSALYMDGC